MSNDDDVIRPVDSIGEDEIQVFPVARFNVDVVPGERLLLRVHFYPSAEAHDARQTEEMNFLIPRTGALALASDLQAAVRDARRLENRKPI